MQAIKRQSDAFNENQIDVKEYYDTLGYSSDGISKIVSLENQEGVVRRSKKIVAYSIVSVIVLLLLTFKFNERRVHQLDTESTVRVDSLSIETYKDVLKSKIGNNKPLFFVASHGKKSMVFMLLQAKL